MSAFEGKKLRKLQRRIKIRRGLERPGFIGSWGMPYDKSNTNLDWLPPNPLLLINRDREFLLCRGVREEVKQEQMVRPMIKDATIQPLGSSLLKWRIILNLILLSAFILFAVGIFAPILTFEKFFIFENRVSIITGLFQLLSEGHFILFGLIFLFSIVFPFLKMLFLCRVCNGDIRNISKHEKLIGWIAKYGKWSMLDVFVAAVLIVTVKLGAVASIEVHYGLYVFAGSVILTMLVTWKIFSLGKTESLGRNSHQINRV